MSMTRHAFPFAVLLATGALAACNRSPTPAASPAVPAPAAASSVATPAPATPAAPGLQPLTSQELQAARVAAADSCNVEQIGKTAFAAEPVAVDDRATTISGWFLSATSKRTTVQARLELINQGGAAGWSMPLSTTVARPDVLASMGGEDSGNTGFAQAIDMSALPAGQYQVVIAFEDGGKAFVCDKGRSITLR